MKKYPLALYVLSALLPTGAWASSAPQTANYGDFYVGAGVGIVVPQSTNISASGVINGSGTVSYKDSAAILGMAGYHFNDYLAGEGELGYTSFDYGNVTGSLGGLSGSLAVNGHVDALVGLANAIVTPLGRKEAWVPYVGGGLGFANTNSSISAVGNTTFSSAVTNDETNLALDAIVGVDFPVASGFSLGARYQYLWVDSSSTSSGSGETASEGNFGVSIITAQATYQF